MTVRVLPYTMPVTQAASPPLSPKRAAISKGTRPSHAPMSIDLSTIPPLVPPSPPSNTLIITNLSNHAIFSASSLQRLHGLLSQPTPLNSFSPLPSLQRLIISYPTVDAAIATRQLLENEPSAPLTSQFSSTEDHSTPLPKIYFGASTPLVGSISSDDIYLKAPSLGKLLFISPPPSPPCGWEIREEDPPNKETHADDLQKALAGLINPSQSAVDVNNEKGASDNMEEDLKSAITEGRRSGRGSRKGSESHSRRSSRSSNGSFRIRKRKERSNTVTVYHPLDHGDNEDLPQVMVEDTTTSPIDAAEDDSDMEIEDSEDTSPISQTDGTGIGALKKAITHTARPPVELMQQ